MFAQPNSDYCPVNFLICMLQNVQKNSGVTLIQGFTSGLCQHLLKMMFGTVVSLYERTS
jgi:hypothetical protein